MIVWKLPKSRKNGPRTAFDFLNTFLICLTKVGIWNGRGEFWHFLITPSMIPVMIAEKLTRSLIPLAEQTPQISTVKEKWSVPDMLVSASHPST
jgi:hypothetical protein